MHGSPKAGSRKPASRSKFSPPTPFSEQSMKTRTTLCALIVFFAAALPAQPRKIALVGGTLIDGNGGRTIRNSVILIDGERITAVGTAESRPVPPRYQVISTEEMSVLPGLWD